MVARRRPVDDFPQNRYPLHLGFGIDPAPNISGEIGLQVFLEFLTEFHRFDEGFEFAGGK